MTAYTNHEGERLLVILRYSHHPGSSYTAKTQRLPYSFLLYSVYQQVLSLKDLSAKSQIHTLFWHFLVALKVAYGLRYGPPIGFAVATLLEE